ncbi:MAG TPA: hypothetical protein VGO68_14350 [Pyrinomonadaceae bacterium]|nr:hypothetical protein [Pyrinomonadaceae bacterium]
MARTRENNVASPSGNASSNAEVVNYSGMLFQGWVSLAFWMVLGLLLESLMAYKAPAYLQDNVRRELFRLGHAHGTVLGLVLIVAALSGERFKVQPARAAQMALRLGAVLMPLGFLLAGIWHYESDPGLGIWLVPAGALLLIFGVISFALASWSNQRRSG